MLVLPKKIGFGLSDQMMKINLAILSTSLSLTVASQGMAETPLDLADQIIAKAQQSCVSDGGQFSVSEGVLQVHEFVTSNGVEELVIVDGQGFECSLGKSYYQGSAGATVHLITTDDHKYGHARGFNIVTAANDIPVILMLLHGTSCNAAGYYPCIQAVAVFDGKLLTTTQ